MDVNKLIFESLQEVIGESKQHDDEMSSADKLHFATERTKNKVGEVKDDVVKKTKEVVGKVTKDDHISTKDVSKGLRRVAEQDKDAYLAGKEVHDQDADIAKKGIGAVKDTIDDHPLGSGFGLGGAAAIAAGLGALALRKKLSAENKKASKKK